MSGIFPISCTISHNVFLNVRTLNFGISRGCQKKHATTTVHLNCLFYNDGIYGLHNLAINTAGVWVTRNFALWQGATVWRAKVPLLAHYLNVHQQCCQVYGFGHKHTAFWWVVRLYGPMLGRKQNKLFFSTTVRLRCQKYDFLLFSFENRFSKTFLVGSMNFFCYSQFWAEVAILVSYTGRW